MENLEKKVDWRQWLPLMIGPGFIIRDAIKGKPHIMDFDSNLRFYVSSVYHMVVSAYPVYLGLANILEKGL